MTVDGGAEAAAADEVIRSAAVETGEDVVEAPSAKRLDRRLDAWSGERVWVLASTVTALGVRVRVRVTTSGMSVAEAGSAVVVKLVAVPLLFVPLEAEAPELSVESVPVIPPVAPVAFMRDSALLSLVQNRVVPADRTLGRAKQD